MADESLPGRERRRIRDELVAGHLPLAEHIALKYQRRGQSMEDLRQVARVGLVAAVDRFDPERGSDFVSYAVPTIMGEVRRYFRDATWMVAVPRRLKELNRSIFRTINDLSAELGASPRPQQIANRLGVSLEAVYEGLQAGMAYQADSLDTPAAAQDDCPAGKVESGVDQIDNRETLHSALAELPQREQDIVRLRFEDELTQRQIAERIGVSQVHVSRLLTHSIAQLREAFLPDD
ncbi:MAG TPA: SigB/SigF/SigG family RNA polymerase sigma factor [Pseudonocardiaceae bacterium]